MKLYINFSNLGNEFLICGHFSFHYLSDTTHKLHLISLLKPLQKRNQCNSSMEFKIFTDIKKQNSYYIKFIINGLPDHDAQIILFANEKNLYKFKQKHGHSVEILSSK